MRRVDKNILDIEINYYYNKDNINLRCNDKQCSFGIQLLQSFSHMCPINIGHKMNGRTTLVGLQRLRHHQRSLEPVKIYEKDDKTTEINLRAYKVLKYQIGAANADIDNVGDGLARETLPGAVPDLVSEFSHMLQNAVNIGHYLKAK